MKKRFFESKEAKKRKSENEDSLWEEELTERERAIFEAEGWHMEEEEEKEAPELGRARSLFEWVELLSAAVVVTMLILTFVGRHSPVQGDSMLPTLQNGDLLITSNMFYEPQVGDIVVFASARTGFDKPYVKRVIATEGQTIDIDFDTWTVYVDGVAIEEPYVNYFKNAHGYYEYDSYLNPQMIAPSSMDDAYAQSYPITVEPGHIFVMGDNRNNSTDSRRIGLVDTRSIIGKVVFRLYPLNKLGTVGVYQP